MLAKNLMASLGALGAYLGFGTAPTLTNYNRSRRPTGAQLRNLEDPVQAARIQAAVAKRERKAKKRDLTTQWLGENQAHHDCANAQSLNPFYIAK